MCCTTNVKFPSPSPSVEMSTPKEKDIEDLFRKALERAHTEGLKRARNIVASLAKTESIEKIISVIQAEIGVATKGE